MGRWKIWKLNLNHNKNNRSNQKTHKHNTKTRHQQTTIKFQYSCLHGITSLSAVHISSSETNSSYPIISKNPWSGNNRMRGEKKLDVERTNFNGGHNLRYNNCEFMNKQLTHDKTQTDHLHLVEVMHLNASHLRVICLDIQGVHHGWRKTQFKTHTSCEMHVWKVRCVEEQHTFVYALSMLILMAKSRAMQMTRCTVSLLITPGILCHTSGNEIKSEVGEIDQVCKSSNQLNNKIDQLWKWKLVIQDERGQGIQILAWERTTCRWLTSVILLIKTYAMTAPICFGSAYLANLAR